MTVLDLPNKKRPVPSVQAMGRWLSDAQKQTGIGAQRLGWLVASTVVLAALQRTLSTDEKPLFVVKGGVYIELQLGLRARTTSDVDMLFRGALADFETRQPHAWTSSPTAPKRPADSIVLSAIGHHCSISTTIGVSHTRH
jgi:hypothetical protein